MGDEVARRDGVADAQDLVVRSQEVDVEREAHAEGVNGGAARDQQPRTGRLAVEQRQSEEPRADSDRDGDLMVGDEPTREVQEAPGR
jgi:hypothetical protein